MSLLLLPRPVYWTGPVLQILRATHAFQRETKTKLFYLGSTSLVKLMESILPALMSRVGDKLIAAHLCEGRL